mmetsp:Transcript_132677/g.296756  ORF Transcript_132677/g.296756 Transcript_132677/m.296756 type:complete len:244 (-) Transcript_132677:251-982(-)
MRLALHAREAAPPRGWYRVVLFYLANGPTPVEAHPGVHKPRLQVPVEVEELGLGATSHHEGPHSPPLSVDLHAELRERLVVEARSSQLAALLEGHGLSAEVEAVPVLVELLIAAVHGELPGWSGEARLSEPEVVLRRLVPAHPLLDPLGNPPLLPAVQVRDHDSTLKHASLRVYVEVEPSHDGHVEVVHVMVQAVLRHGYGLLAQVHLNELTQVALHYHVRVQDNDPAPPEDLVVNALVLLLL